MNIKGIKNTLADTISRLIDIDPQVKPEPEDYEFGYYILDELPSLEVSDIEATSGSITNIETEDDSDKNFQKFPIDEGILHKLGYFWLNNKNRN